MNCEKPIEWFLIYASLLVFFLVRVVLTFEFCRLFCVNATDVSRSVDVVVVVRCCCCCLLLVLLVSNQSFPRSKCM